MGQNSMTDLAENLSNIKEHFFVLYLEVVFESAIPIPSFH